MKKIADYFISKRKRFFLLFFDFFGICACYGLSWTSITNERIKSEIAIYILMNACVITAVLGLFKTYRHIWRFAQMRDYLVVALGVLCGSGICFVCSIFTDLKSIIAAFDGGSKLYYMYVVFASVVCMLGLVVMRMFYRTIYDVRKSASLQTNKSNCRRTVIVGAGQACWLLLSDIQHTDCDYFVVGVVDDDNTKIGRNIENIPIFGPIEKIDRIVEKLSAEIIIIAIPSANKESNRRIVGLCNNTGCDVRIIPDLYRMVNSRKLITQIQKIEPEDLLGREPVVLDVHESARLIGDKVVMVTGGGGSIGSELCRQIMHYSPKLLIIVDIYENNAYDIQQELLGVYGAEANIKVHIASVRDYEKMKTLFAFYRPHLVFHAAAHKHVPLMENDPEEAIKNNITGTYNIAKLANLYGVERFLLISSDKAVNPTNVMGATKRFCEMIIQHFNASFKGTEYCAVRFGNVLGSNGSVIPLFTKLIEQKKDIPVTHPDITRYFMTIPEAVSLVLRAGAMTQGGEIFVLDMGEPVKIDELARNLIRLHGYVPGKDIKIKYVGLRPGEKLYEETLMGGNLKSTYHDKIFIEETGNIDGEKLMEDYSVMCKNAAENNSSAVVDALLNAVPTFTSKGKERKIINV